MCCATTPSAACITISSSAIAVRIRRRATIAASRRWCCVAICRSWPAVRRCSIDGMQSLCVSLCGIQLDLTAPFSVQVHQLGVTAAAAAATRFRIGARLAAQLPHHHAHPLHTGAAAARVSHGHGPMSGTANPGHVIVVRFLRGARARAVQQLYML